MKFKLILKYMALSTVFINTTCISNAQLKIDKVYEDEKTIEFNITTNEKSDYISLPSGNKIKKDSLKYISTANGTYTFSTHSKNNQISESSISVNSLRSNSLVTSNPNIRLEVSSFDALSGVEYMRFKNEISGNWSVFEPYQTETTWVLDYTDGQKTVYGQFKDRAGNISDDVFDSIYLDIIPPVSTIFHINNNDLYTNDENVTLTINATDNYSTIKSMNIYNENENLKSFNYSETKDWTLPLGDGEKKVYLNLIDGVNNISGAYMDSIILDQTLPSGFISIAEAMIDTDGTYIVPSPEVTLNLSGFDRLSGVKEVNIYEGSHKTSVPGVSGNEYSKTITWTLDTSMPTTFLTLEVIDNAGNVYRVDTQPIRILSLKIVDFYLNNVFNPGVFKNSFTRLSWYGSDEEVQRPAGFPKQPMLAGGNIDFSLKYDIRDDSLASYDLKWKYIITIKSPTDSPLNPWSYTTHESEEFMASQSEKNEKTVYGKYTIPYGTPIGSIISIEIHVKADCYTRTGGHFVQEKIFPIDGGKAQIGEVTGDVRESIKFNEIE